MFLRGVAAFWTIFCVIWLGFVLKNAVGLGFGLLGTLVAVVWAVMIAKAKKRARGHVALCLTRERLIYRDGIDTFEIAWTDVHSIEVDEELLVVLILRSSGSPVRVEPLFRGMGVYDLADAVRAAWLEASTQITR
jgi:hypothetical protein